MKYIAFGLALIAAFPAAAVCSVSRRCLALLMGMAFVVILKFDSTALNFISYEFYRGTARGMEVSLAYIISFSVILSLLFRGRKIKLFPDFGAVLFLFYFLWSVVSAVENNNLMIVSTALVEGRNLLDFPLMGRMVSFFEIWKMVMLYIVFIAVYGFLDFSRNAKALIQSLAIVVIICFLMVVKQHVTGVYQAKGPFPHQNSMALFMMLLGPVFFSIYVNLPRSVFRMVCTFAFVCASGALFRTYSRGAMMCYPVAAGLTAALSVFCKFKPRVIMRLVPITLCGLLGVAAMMPRIIERFALAPKSSGDTRKYLAQTAANVMRTRPWTGIGVNNWSVYVNTHPEVLGDPEYRPSGASDKSVGIVETIYLLVGAECGIPGLVLLVIWLLYYWIVSFRLCFKLAGTQWFYLPAGLFGGLTGCCLQSALEWVLKQQLNFLMLMVCFAVLSWLNRNWFRLKQEELAERRQA